MEALTSALGESSHRKITMRWMDVFLQVSFSLRPLWLLPLHELLLVPPPDELLLFPAGRTPNPNCLSEERGPTTLTRNIPSRQPTLKASRQASLSSREINFPLMLSSFSSPGRKSRNCSRTSCFSYSLPSGAVGGQNTHGWVINQEG